jgi:hypothetical protein
MIGIPPPLRPWSSRRRRAPSHETACDLPSAFPPAHQWCRSRPGTGRTAGSYGCARTATPPRSSAMSPRASCPKPPHGTCTACCCRMGAAWTLTRPDPCAARCARAGRRLRLADRGPRLQTMYSGSGCRDSQDPPAPATRHRRVVHHRRDRRAGRAGVRRLRGAVRLRSDQGRRAAAV